MDNLIGYGSSDEEDNELEMVQQPVAAPAPVAKPALSLPKKRAAPALSLSSLPAPQKKSRKKERMLLKQILMKKRDQSDTLEDEDVAGDGDGDGDGVESVAENGGDGVNGTDESVSGKEDVSKEPQMSSKAQLPIMQMNDVGPSPPSPNQAPPEPIIPPIMFEGKLVTPPPGLKPPPTLGKHLSMQMNQFVEPTDPMVIPLPSPSSYCLCWDHDLPITITNFITVSATASLIIIELIELTFYMHCSLLKDFVKVVLWIFVLMNS